MVVWLCGAAVLYSTVGVRRGYCMLHQSCSCVILSLLDLMCFEVFKVRCLYIYTQMERIILFSRFFAAIY